MNPIVGITESENEQLTNILSKNKTCNRPNSATSSSSSCQQNMSPTPCNLNISSEFSNFSVLSQIIFEEDEEDHNDQEYQG